MADPVTMHSLAVLAEIASMAMTVMIAWSVDQVLIR